MAIFHYVSVFFNSWRKQVGRYPLRILSRVPGTNFSSSVLSDPAGDLNLHVALLQSFSHTIATGGIGGDISDMSVFSGC